MFPRSIVTLGFSISKFEDVFFWTFVMNKCVRGWQRSGWYHQLNTWSQTFTTKSSLKRRQARTCPSAASRSPESSRFRHFPTYLCTSFTSVWLLRNRPSFCCEIRNFTKLWLRILNSDFICRKISTFAKSWLSDLKLQRCKICNFYSFLP